MFLFIVKGIEKRKKMKTWCNNGEKIVNENYLANSFTCCNNKDVGTRNNWQTLLVNETSKVFNGLKGLWPYTNVSRVALFIFSIGCIQQYRRVTTLVQSKSTILVKIV